MIARDAERVRRLRRVLLVALSAVAVLVVLVVAAYAVFGRPRPGRVAPQVVLAGQPVGGTTAARLTSAVERVAARWPATQVRGQVGGERFTTSAEALGTTVDVPATVRAAQEVGRGGNVLQRVADWVTSPLRRPVAPLRFDADDRVLRETLLRLDPGPTRAPREPTFRLGAGPPVVVPGRAGLGAPPASVLRAIAAAAVREGPVGVSVRRGAVPPRFSDDDARSLAAEAMRLSADGVAVRAGDAAATVPADQLRPWLGATAGPDRLGLTVDEAAAAKGLQTLLPNAGTPAVDAGFTVTAEGVAITPARAGTACCEAEPAARAVLAALRDGASTPVELPLRTVAPRRTDDAASRLGIREVVATFSTPHKCCEPRVRNIHRIADLVRGMVIEPGQTFSVNTAVGRRTAAKGFVDAPVIANGRMASDVGGGVSQFATTLFNAAWFAGLGFGEYQSHSLYISRYPYGRDATLGFPNPDLQIKNTTPHGVLIWPTYTGTTLTVTLYSTKVYASVTMSNQTRRPQGTCTSVASERTRVGLDGKTTVDRTSARYRAEEGLNCDGSRTAEQPAD